MSLRSTRVLLLLLIMTAHYSLVWTAWTLTGRRLLENWWQAAHAKNSKRLADSFAHLGGVYIKLGQVMSVMGTFLPEAYCRQLERLQDAAPARPFAEVEPRLIAALGKQWRSRFDHFQEQAVAAASLSQVHRARLTDGSDVAVKILYPDIEELIEADLRLIGVLVPWVHRLFGFQRMETVVQQLATMLSEETNYVTEANNLARLAQLLADNPKLRLPRVEQELSTASVLVMSWESGYKLSDRSALPAGSTAAVGAANQLVDCYLSMLLVHRVLHADPHPGNFLVQDGRLVLLDFGAVTEVSETLVSGLKKVIIGGLSRNPDQVLSGVEEMGFVAEDGDRELLREVGREYLRSLGGLQVNNYKQLSRAELRRIGGVDQLQGRLRKVTASVRYPDGYFYLERTLLLLFGVVADLAPDKGLLGIAAPYASKILLRSYSKKAETSQSLAPSAAGSSTPQSAQVPNWRGKAAN